MSRPPVPANDSVDLEQSFDPRSVAIALRRRLVWMVLIILLAVLVGFAAVYLGDTARYRATTVLLVSPTITGEPGRDPAYSINTEASMVELPSNLEQLRSQLNLNASREKLADAINVAADPRSSLINIVVEWSDPEAAATIANAISELFLQQSQKTRQEKLQTQKEAIEQRLVPLRDALSAAKAELQQYMSENAIYNLAEETRALLQEQSSLNLLYEQTKTDQATIKKQQSAMAAMIPELQARIDAETTAAEGLATSPGDRMTQIQRLRQQIQDERERKSNLALLEQRRAALARVAGLREGISQEEREKLLADVRAIEARLSDTTSTLQWQNQIDFLYDSLNPTLMGGTPAVSLLESVQNRQFDVQLQALSLDEKLANIEEAKARVQARLAQIPVLEPRYSQLNRRVAELEAEIKTAESTLAGVDREISGGTSRLRIVSEAAVPAVPIHSNRKIYFAGGAGISGSIGFAVLIASVLLSRRIRTSKDAQLATGLRVLAELPARYDPDAAFPKGEQPTVFAERFRIVAEAVRGTLPSHGGKLLCVAATPGEGTTLVAANLDAVFGAQDWNVLLVEANVRKEEAKRRGKQRLRRLSYLVPSYDDSTPGLGAFLTQRESSLEEMVLESTLPRVNILPSDSSSVLPDALGGSRMAAAFAEATKRYSIIIVDSPPMQPYYDARALARQCDVALLIIKAGSSDSAPAKWASEELAATGIRIAGIVVTDVKKPYARRGPGNG